MRAFPSDGAGRPSTRLVVFAPHYAEYATRLATALTRHARVLLIVDRGNQTQECDPRLMPPPGDLEVVTFDSVGRANRIRSLATIVWRTLRFRPHAILFQEEEGALSAWTARILGPLFPILLTAHDPSPHTGTDELYLRQNRKHQQTIRSLAKAFHVHGAFCHGQLVSHLGTRRPIVQTAHGVILTPNPDDLREAERGRILMFGRMEAYKGLDLLLDAAEILTARNVPFRLVLAGRGPELSRLRERMEKNPSIEILDCFLSPSEAVAQFQRAAVVVLPYRNATQSGVIAAAFGNGRPVVATRVGGLVDAVDHDVNGVLVPPQDAPAFSAALRVLLENDDKVQDLRGGASRSAKSSFDWSFIAAEIIKALEVFGKI